MQRRLTATERLMFQVFAQKDNQPLSTSDLAVQVNSPQNTIGALCRRLQKEGLLSQTLDAHDRRVTLYAPISSVGGPAQ